MIWAQGNLIPSEDFMKTRRTIHRIGAGLVLAALALTVGIVVPGYCQDRPLPGPATKALPTNPSWVPTGNLSVPRSSHTATLLRSGKVLVVGGGGIFDSAELYDPVTGTWSVTGSLNKPRGWHTATLLQDGRVLVAGGYNSGSPLSFGAAAELYDPGAGTWTPTGNLNVAGFLHTATLLPSGKVLIAGGYQPRF